MFRIKRLEDKRTRIMKKSILILIAFTMLSCEDNLKTDREIAIESHQISLAQEEVKEIKEQLKQFKDSLAILAIKEERFKDSLEFTNLSQTMCWDKRDHRHSCEIYGNSLMKASNETINEQLDEAIFVQSEVAINE